jgi:hypothetical protein
VSGPRPAITSHTQEPRKNREEREGGEHAAVWCEGALHDGRGLPRADRSTREIPPGQGGTLPHDAGLAVPAGSP